MWVQIQSDRYFDVNIFKKNCAVLHFKHTTELLKQSGAKNKSRADGSILWLRGVCYLKFVVKKTCHFVQKKLNPGMFILFLWFNLVPPQPLCQTPYSPYYPQYYHPLYDQSYISLLLVVQLQFPGLRYLHVVFPIAIILRLILGQSWSAMKNYYFFFVFLWWLQIPERGSLGEKQLKKN